LVLAKNTRGDAVEFLKKYPWPGNQGTEEYLKEFYHVTF
jgi:hypothetical protein